MTEQKLVAANPAFITYTVNVDNTPTFSTLRHRLAEAYRLQLLNHYASLVQELSDMPLITVTESHESLKDPEVVSEVRVSGDGKCRHPRMNRFNQFTHCPDCRLS